MLENKIQSQIIKKKSFLCVGLDVDINKIPKSFFSKPTSLPYSLRYNFFPDFLTYIYQLCLSVTYLTS